MNKLPRITHPADFPVEQKAPKAPPTCYPRTVLKISSVVLGLLLVAGAITAHFYHVNSIAVYSMGSAGGFLILATAITSCVQRGIHRRKENQRVGLEQSARAAQIDGYALAQKGDVQGIRTALQNNRLSDPNDLLKRVASEGRADIVALLLENGTDPKDTSGWEESGYSAIHLALKCPDHQKGLATMKVLLTHDSSLASLRVKEGNRTPLHLVVIECNPASKDLSKQKIELLLHHGADVNALDNHSSTPLHEAATASDRGFANPEIEVIEILVRAGASCAAINDQGFTPLQLIQQHLNWYNDNQWQLFEALNPLPS